MKIEKVGKTMIGRRVFSMAELKAQEYPTREEMEEIYSRFNEGKDIRLQPNRVSDLYESMNKLFDDFETEIVLEAFWQGYICGKASE